MDEPLDPPLRDVGSSPTAPTGRRLLALAGGGVGPARYRFIRTASTLPAQVTRRRRTPFLQCDQAGGRHQPMKRDFAPMRLRFNTRPLPWQPPGPGFFRRGRRRPRSATTATSATCPCGFSPGEAMVGLPVGPGAATFTSFSIFPKPKAPSGDRSPVQAETGVRFSLALALRGPSTAPAPASASRSCIEAQGRARDHAARPSPRHSDTIPTGSRA